MLCSNSRTISNTYHQRTHRYLDSLIPGEVPQIRNVQHKAEDSVVCQLLRKNVNIGQQIPRGMLEGEDRTDTTWSLIETIYGMAMTESQIEKTFPAFVQEVEAPMRDVINVVHHLQATIVGEAAARAAIDRSTTSATEGGDPSF